MILYITFSGKDTVHINAVDAIAGANPQELGAYDFSAQKESGISFLENLLLIAKAQEFSIEEITGIIVQWGTESRFTVSRLTGATLNALAATRQLPMIAQKTDESLQSAIERLQNTPNAILAIEYSADPRLG